MIAPATKRREIHTGDLTAACLKGVQLRIEGKIDPSMTTALYRGQLAGCACAYIHERDAWTAAGVSEAIEAAEAQVEQMAEDERRPLSDSVTQNRAAIAAEVHAHVSHYVERLGGYFAKCKLIGCELPIRWTTELPGCGEVVFASHLDLLFTDPTGTLKCWDWKWRDESPSMDYLGRNMQFALYFLMLAHGEVRVDAELDLWERYEAFADFAWVDLARFKPYARKTECKDYTTGEVITYGKGDHRPLDTIVRRWTFSPDREADILRELCTRVVMLDHGLAPTNPDPIGCICCESSRWCPAFHLDKGSER